MKLLNFFCEDELRLGAKTEKGVLDITARAGKEGLPKSMIEYLNASREEREALKAYVAKAEAEEGAESFIDESGIKYGCVSPAPQKIIGMGANYYSLGATRPDKFIPFTFAKYSNSLCACGDEVPIPFNSNEADFEAELAIVIGKTARNVSVEDALDYAAGYCNVDDFTARDLQNYTTSWVPGKCCDRFAPLGPYLVTPDEVGDPNAGLYVRSYVNGKLFQDCTTSDMIFSCAELISGLSRIAPLLPGDVILTGTPYGHILTLPEDQHVYLKPGDEVVIEVEKLGRLVNVMCEDSLPHEEQL